MDLGEYREPTAVRIDNAVFDFSLTTLWGTIDVPTIYQNILIILKYRKVRNNINILTCVVDKLLNTSRNSSTDFI